MTSLVELLPGGEKRWLCQAGDDCTANPLTIVTVGFFMLSHAGNMDNMSLYQSFIFCMSWIMLNSVGITVPTIVVEILMLIAVGIHIPMLNAKQSYFFMSFVALVIGGFTMGQKENTLFVLAIWGLLSFCRRVFLIVITLRAHFPTPLIFPIVSHIMPRWAFNDHDFFRTDNPPEEIAQKREKAFEELYKKWCSKFPKSIKTSTYLGDKFSDLRFCAGNRVFIPFQKKLESWCDPCTVVESVDRTDLIDIDGHRLTDCSGSYGVNVCGYDEYKKFITEGWELTKNVGCVLGPLHPLLEENINMLREVSGKQEVSFHMSGTEAVMSATRMCRFNTRKRYVVLFGGAYHGWWDGVQPMAGNERVPDDIITLKDMNPASMDVIRYRAHEIAAVVINPLQAFHPNAPPPSDLILTSNVRDVSESTMAYKRWLDQMRKVCTEKGIVLVFDEVYTGFRLAPGGAQEYFSIQADMVVYGKTTGGGIANGIVCGPRNLMARSDPTKPLRQAYVVGTFAAHPLLVGSMNRFLKWATSKKAKAEYDRLRNDVAQWVKDTNKRLEAEFPSSTAPLALAAYSSVWTMIFKRPGRYHWLLQYYLKDEGLNLSWVGTGRLSFSLDFQREDLDKITEKIVKACHRMDNDGWWWVKEGASPSGISIKINLVTEIVRALVKRVFGISSQ